MLIIRSCYDIDVDVDVNLNGGLFPQSNASRNATSAHICPMLVPKHEGTGIIIGNIGPNEHRVQNIEPIL